MNRIAFWHAADTKVIPPVPQGGAGWRDASCCCGPSTNVDAARDEAHAWRWRAAAAFSSCRRNRGACRRNRGACRRGASCCCGPSTNV